MVGSADADVESAAGWAVDQFVGRNGLAAQVALASFQDQVLVRALGLDQAASGVLADDAKDVHGSPRTQRFGDVLADGRRERSRDRLRRATAETWSFARMDHLPGK